MTLDVLLHQVSCGSRQLLPDGTPQLQANTIKLAPVLLGSVSGNEAEDGVAALTADLGQNHERIGLDLALAGFTNVVLHIGLEVIGMIAITEILAATGLEVVDPRQPVAVDELDVEAKSDDDQIFRRPAHCAQPAHVVCDYTA